ncbi:MAG: MFS transporter [Bacteriovoracia bacterium]
MATHPTTTPVPALTSYEKFVVGILAFLQFTIILDFMILSPLGAILMPTLNITPSQFGFVVSVYAFSAGISGFLSAGFADRFDRKRLLLFFYAGFILGTLFCGLAPTYHLLVLARMITGLFGGVIGSIVLAIATDLFPLETRGRVMGVVQSAFAASQVMGLPLGLYISSLWGWHAPFILIVVISSLVGGLIIARLRPIDGHLKLQTERKAVRHLIQTVLKPRHQIGFLTMALLATGGFMLMPFGSAFTVHNLGIPFDRLPLIYMITGTCTIIAGPLLGRASDRHGKFPVFFFGSLLSITIVLIYTRLGPTPFWAVTLLSALLFIGITARIISSSALITAVPAPADRGAFMAVNASIQQISGGLAAGLAGMIVIPRPDGSLGRYEVLGYVVTAAMLFVLAMMSLVNRMVTGKRIPPPSVTLPAAG